MRDRKKTQMQRIREIIKQCECKQRETSRECERQIIDMHKVIRETQKGYMYI